MLDTLDSGAHDQKARIATHKKTGFERTVI
jgi:calcium-dependent protein kinase